MLEGDYENWRQWRDEGIDDFYKGKMPTWWKNDELATANDEVLFDESGFYWF